MSAVPENDNFNLGLQEVQLFTNFRLHPESEFYRLQVHAYYMYHLLDYWSKIIYYITSGQAAKDELGPYSSKVPYTELQLRDYELYVIDTINFIKEHPQVDLASICDLFTFISAVACLSTDPAAETDKLAVIRESNGLDSVIYPILNDTGLYGIGAYFHGFFEGQLSIIGFPIGRATYDQDVGCPLKFVEHDILHTRTSRRMFGNEWGDPLKTIPYPKTDFARYRALYRRIISSDLEALQKQCLLSVMFITLHELNDPILSNYYLSNPEVITNIAEKTGYLLESGASVDFKAQFDTYMGFLLAPDNSESLADAIEATEPEPGSLLAQVGEMLRGRQHFPGDDDPQESDLYPGLTEGPELRDYYITFLLAYWYFARYASMNTHS